MKRMFLIILGFYIVITVAGIMFMGARLFVVKERVESLTEAQKSLIKRVELRDTIYQLKDAITKDRPEAELRTLRSKAQAIITECYGCHHPNTVVAHIKDMENGIKQFVKELSERDPYEKHEKVLITVKHITTSAEDAYVKAKSLTDVRLGHVRHEIYRVRGTGIVIGFAGLFLFVGFSAASLRRISRLESEAKERESRLIQSEKLAAIGRVTAGVAHELNNPLTAVSGFCELLLKTSADDNVKTMAEKINKSADRMANIVRDLLAFSKSPTLKRTQVNIKEMVDETLDLVSEVLHVSKITVSKDITEEIAMPLDKEQMERVLLNLISNAIHAIRDSGKGDKIILKAYKENNRLIIEVSDNGPGIPQQIIDRIFEPFFTTKGFGKGTGLGLSICYNIIKAHGGDIRVKSIEAEGTTFVIELPIVCPPVDGATPCPLTPSTFLKKGLTKGRIFYSRKVWFGQK